MTQLSSSPMKIHARDKKTAIYSKITSSGPSNAAHSLISSDYETSNEFKCLQTQDALIIILSTLCP